MSDEQTAHESMEHIYKVLQQFVKEASICFTSSHMLALQKEVITIIMNITNRYFELSPEEVKE